MSRPTSRPRDNFKLFYTNVNSLRNKLSEIALIAFQLSLCIICLTETHLNKNFCDAEISIPNFEVFREDRSTGSGGGGSAIYVRKDLKAEKN